MSQTGTPATAAPASTSSLPQANTAAGGLLSYHSDALHLTYSYPGTFTDASAVVGPAIQASMGQMGDPKDEAHCMTIPFSVMGPGAGGLAVVALARADAGCLHRTLTPADLAQFSRGQVQGLTASGARTQFGSPVSYNVAGHPALLTQGTFQLPTGQILQSMFACVFLKPDIACWQFLASARPLIDTMRAFPVALDGAPPEPLIPANLLAKP